MANISLQEIRKSYSYSSSDSWYARMVSRRLSPYFSWLFIRTPITPNQITGMMMLAGVAGGIMLYLGGYINQIISLILFQLFLILDCVDGEVARIKKIFSNKGKYLDAIANDLVAISLFGGMASLVWQGRYFFAGIPLYHNCLAFVLGGMVILFFLLAKLSCYYSVEAGNGITGSLERSAILGNGTRMFAVGIIDNICC
jgi:phosphatidylglycerophosphate synthase